MGTLSRTIIKRKGKKYVKTFTLKKGKGRTLKCKVK